MALFAPSQVAIILSNRYINLSCCRLLGSMYINQFMQNHMVSSHTPLDMVITISMFYPIEREHGDPVGLLHLECEARDSLHWS
jgi:hypothetical protein